MEFSSKAFYGLIATLALGLLGWGLMEAGGTGAAFALFAFLTLGGALLCVWERSVVRSAFALMGTFLGTAGFFLLLGADFLAMAQILIYVGGILALLLFGVMLSPPDLSERKLPRVISAMVGVLAAFGLVAFKVAATVKWARADELPPTRSRADEIGVGFIDPEGYLIAFELAGVLLTVALVAAVYIARRKPSDFEPEVDTGALSSGEGGAA